MNVEFQSWPKIPRHNKALTVTITEKIDGTNGQIFIFPFSQMTTQVAPYVLHSFSAGGTAYCMVAGSRSRYLLPEKGEDNFGFAQWVLDNKEDLSHLGQGRHYGEWYGMGIQRTYGLSERRFALFNTARWSEEEWNEKPFCCDVVPIIYRGELDRTTVKWVMHRLKAFGSIAVDEFMNPEGIVIYNHTLKVSTKLTFEHVDGKWIAEGNHEQVDTQ